jgi:heme exporter protein B
LNAVKTIFIKELMVEFRSKQMINSYFILSLMIITSFRFAFSVMDFSLTSLASPILWITFFFGGMFSLSPVYKREIEQGTREGLLLAPISPSSIYLGKFLANLLVISFLELFTLLIFFVFFPVDTPDLLTLLTIVAIGTIGIVALGNIISAISSNLAQSEVMLPVLLVPVLLFTIVMSSVSATSKVFVGAHFLDVIQEIKFILAFDVVFIAVGYLLIDYILED